MTEFRPPRGLGSAHLQSVLASSGLRRWWARNRSAPLIAAEQSWELDAGHGVRLHGLYSAQADRAPRGLVILLHGWEGSAASSYLVVTGAELFHRGFDVFRLHFRDHGPSHHLNADLFHSCRIDEVVGGIADLLRRTAVRPVGVAGYSLGGNFTLRVGLHAPAAGLDLAHLVAVCPVLDPAKGLTAIEDAPLIYERYFLRKWRRSLSTKERLFPDRYDFRPWRRETSLRALTARLVADHTEFASLEDYLDGYTINGDRLSGLQVPATLITAADDPIIPVEDFRALTLSASTELVITDSGGHCGFIEDWRLRSWIERTVADRLQRALCMEPMAATASAI